MRRAHWIRDLAVYTIIGAGVIAAIAFYAIYSARTDGPTSLPLDWLQFAAMTALVFGNTLRQFWKWKSRRLWLAWTLFAVAHFAIFVPLISVLHPVPIIWIMFAAVAEQVVISDVIARVITSRRDGRRSA